MADKYYRLVCLITDVCTEPARELFLKLAKSDPGKSFYDLKSYLGLRQVEIAKLQSKKFIRRDQQDLLFPSCGLPDVLQWDITLLVTLITNLFKGHLQPLEHSSLEEMRDIRNKLQHIANTTHMPDSTFNSYWERLQSAATTLAREVSGITYENDIGKKIQTTLVNNMPGLGDALKVFYEEDRKQMLEDLKQMAEDQRQMANQLTKLRDDLDKVRENENQMSEEIKSQSKTIQDLRTKTDVVTETSADSNSLLRSAIVTKIGNKGEKLKLFKTVDHTTERLKMRFQRTFSTLREGFTPTQGIPEIKQQLQDNHYVIVAGGRSSSYLETALYVLKDSKYNVQRCVEIVDSSDWRHVDPGEVDLVLWQSPFGHSTYDGVKAASMFGLLDAMYHATHPSEEASYLSVVIVTDLDVFSKAKTAADHSLLDVVVKLFDSTSPSSPDDLTGSGTAPWQEKVNNDFASQMTGVILDKYERRSKHVDPATLQSAKAKLKKNKALLITGPPKCGKTSLFVALAASYAREKVIILFSPDDIRRLDFNSTSLVVIDDVIGKYFFDKSEVAKWYSGLDILHDAVLAGKLTVIVTVTDHVLKQCLETFFKHRLLSEPEVITSKTCLVKLEDLAIKGVLHKDEVGDSSLLPADECVRSVISVTQHELGEVVCHTFGCCLLPRGEILLVCDSMNVMKLDSAYRVTAMSDLSKEFSYEFSDPYHTSVACINNNVAAIAFKEKLLYLDISDSISVTKTMDLGYSARCIACCRDRLYILSDSSVYSFTLDGKAVSIIYLDSDLNCTSLAAADDGSRIYTIDVKRKMTTLDRSGDVINILPLEISLEFVGSMCVDDRGNVWIGGLDERVFQVSADGARILNTISVDGLDYNTPLCYDRHKSSLVFCDYKSIRTVKLD